MCENAVVSQPLHTKDTGLVSSFFLLLIQNVINFFIFIHFKGLVNRNYKRRVQGTDSMFVKTQPFL